MSCKSLQATAEFLYFKILYSCYLLDRIVLFRIRIASMEGGPRSNDSSNVSTSTSPVPLSYEDEIIESIQEAISRLNLAGSNDTVKYFSGFVEMADFVKKRPDLIDDRLFYLVFKYVKAYFNDTQDRKCTEHLEAVLDSGNQFNARNLELVFLWAMQHEFSNLMNSLLQQKMCFIRKFPPVVFKLFISQQKLPKYFEYLLFSNWSCQMQDEHTTSILKELYDYTARKGTPEMLKVFFQRCEFLNNEACVVSALELAIDELNIPNVVFLWKNKHLSSGSRKKMTVALMKEQNVDILEALQQDDANSNLCEKVVFRVTQMHALGELNVDDAKAILAMVEAYVAIIVELNEIDPRKRREYYLGLGFELLESCKQISKRAKDEGQREENLIKRMQSIFDSDEPKPLPRNGSLLDEILNPRRIEPREFPSDQLLSSSEDPQGVSHHAFLPLRKASQMRLRKHAQDEVRRQYGDSLHDPKPNQGYGSPPL